MTSIADELVNAKIDSCANQVPAANQILASTWSDIIAYAVMNIFLVH